MLIHPVILCGGSGTRLWPLSREQHPKQLSVLLGERTMLQDTVMRLEGTEVAAPIVICNEEYRFLVAEQLRQLNKPWNAIVLEPVGRNTAPALTYAALMLTEQTDDALMLVMPADHVVQAPQQFHAAMVTARALALSGQVVTFGIAPSRAETGYGYIKRGPAHIVEKFVEKPDFATAQKYLQSGDYFWNSGIFMLSARVWLEELARLRPDMPAACKAICADKTKDGDFIRLPRAQVAQCPADSIDYAVMEKTTRASVVPLDAGWSDVGAFPAFWDIAKKDADGNIARGDVWLQDSKNSLVISERRFVATLGVEDLIVVETGDAVLVAHKDHAQDVRKIVDQLKLKRRDEYKVHRKVERPWGSYECVDLGPRFQVKRIVVKPRAALSLQMHHHRAEHWVVVCGTAKVTRGEDVYLVSENESTFIPLGVKHRLENPGAIPLEMIEVQSGSYLGEDDIVRFEDRYCRS